MRNSKTKRQRGFTLLELLMVVIIIGILASIAIPQYFRAAERARAAEALQINATIRGGELRYKAQDPGDNLTFDLNLLDVSVPGFGGVPVSNLWVYSVDTGTGNAIATRVGGGTFNGATIEIDIVAGTSCASDPVYGLTVGTGC